MSKRKLKAIAACILCASCALTLLPLPPAMAGGSAQPYALEETQLAEYGLAGEELSTTLDIKAQHIEEIAIFLEQLTNAIKQYEHAILMASHLNALDVLGLSKFMNSIRKVAKSAIGLYDTIDNLDEVLESAYEGHKKNFLDLGFDNIRDFAKARDERYLKDVFAQMKRGTETLNYVEETMKTKYDTNSTIIANMSTFMDTNKGLLSIVNDLFAASGKILVNMTGQGDLLSETFAGKVEKQRQLDMFYEYWREAVYEPDAENTAEYIPSSFAAFRTSE